MHQRLGVIGRAGDEEETGDVPRTALYRRLAEALSAWLAGRRRPQLPTLTVDNGQPNVFRFRPCPILSPPVKL